MKTFLKSLRRQDGFTLVELMVVVAIIGLLSAVAIPNFKKYQAKAKMSEAKLQLSALYTAQTAFFSDYNMYGQCLTYMGFDPGPEAQNRYYAVGLPTTGVTINAAAYSSAVSSGLNTTDCPAAYAGIISGGVNLPSTNSANFFGAAKGIGASIATTSDFVDSTGFGDQSIGANMVFTAGAGGVISEQFTTEATASALTITNTKLFSIIRNGF